MVTGTDQQTQEAINAGVLPVLHRLLRHTKPVIQKEAAWTLSNIAAGPSQQIQQIINCGLLAPLVELLDKVRDGHSAAAGGTWGSGGLDGSFVEHLAPEPPEQTVSELLRSLAQLEHSDFSADLHGNTSWSCSWQLCPVSVQHSKGWERDQPKLGIKEMLSCLTLILEG